MNLNPSIPLLSADSPPKRASFSRWISIDVLMDEEELTQLHKNLSPHLLYMHPRSLDQSCQMHFNDLIKSYTDYITALKNHEVPNPKNFKPFFHAFLAANLDGLAERPMGTNKKILESTAPLIEVKPISLIVSKVDDSIRVMPINPKGILWGLRFSFPQMIQQAGSALIETIDADKYPTQKLFKNLRKFVRDTTRATPFVFHFKKINLPIRLGKNCFSWINNHPQLTASNLTVNTAI